MSLFQSPFGSGLVLDDKFGPANLTAGARFGGVLSVRFQFFQIFWYHFSSPLGGGGFPEMSIFL